MLKLKGILVALVALPIIVGAASAGTTDNILRQSIYTNYQAVTAAKVPVAISLRPPPLKLPDFEGRTHKLRLVKLDLLGPRLKKSMQVVHFFENHKHHWLTASRKQKCWAVPWQRQCTIARATLRLHRALVDIAENRLAHEIPYTQNWTRAMRYAQRPFPGTYDWLSFISNRECRACYTTTAFICNYEGSGACGPMQFMSGTFYGHADDARDYLAAHGYIIPRSAWEWSSQLGQALTAAYMRYTHQDGCHWCL